MPISSYLQGLRDRVGTLSLLLPSVDGLVTDAEGRILLQKRTDNGHWGLPGGTLEPLEPPALGVMREVFEETGLKVVPTQLLGVFGGVPSFHVRYPGGDELDAVTALFDCRVVGGELGNRDGEASEVGFYAPDELPEPLTPIARYLLEAAAAGRGFAWDDAWLASLAG